MASDAPMFSPPSTMGSGQLHYLVYAPQTPPLGAPDRSNEHEFKEFSAGRPYVDLLLRVADTDRLHEDPTLDLWLRIRVFITRESLRPRSGNRVHFSGTAYELNATGELTGSDRIWSGTVSITDQPANVQIGEGKLTRGGTT